MPESSVNITMPALNAKVEMTVTSEQILEAIKDTNDLPERAKEVVENLLNNYKGEDFKSLSDFLEIGFSPETVETLKNCTEIVQLFL